MAALLRGLRAGTALRGFSCAVLSTVPRGSPQCSALRRALHCAAPLRLQEDSTSNKDPASTTNSTTSTPSYHEHYQAHPADQDGTTAAAEAAACPEEEPATANSQEPPASSQEPSASPQEASASDTVAEDAPQPDTSFADQDGEEQEDEEYETEEQLQARVLTTALEFVPLHGWSTEAIAAAAETVGLSTASTGMFPNGAGDLVLHFISQCNAQLAEILAEQQNQVQLGHAEPKKTADFLRDAVETRLRMLIPYMETWPQAMSILLLPHNLPDSLKHLSTLVDDMWYYAGDRSTDLNWYTKRAALTGIYNTTELVMLQDSSPDFQDTWAFLDNRIQDIIKMATTAKQVKSTGEAVVQGVMGAAITLKNLTGVNQRR